MAEQATTMDSAQLPAAEQESTAPVLAGEEQDRSVEKKQGAMIPQEPKGVITEFLAQPAVKRAFPAIVALVVFFISIIVYSLINTASYRALYDGLSDQDQAEIYNTLLASGIPVEIDRTSGKITVPHDQYYQAKLHLASEGLPRASSLGFDMVRKDQSMGTSQFMEQMRYKLATEEELAKSVATIQSIRSARVHLAIPKQSVFIRNRENPKASVVVFPHQGRSVSQEQVQAIVHLVASSIPFMEANSVSVVDNWGNLLHSEGESDELDLSNKQLSFRSQLEEMYRKRVVSLLSPFLGMDNFQVEINAEVDFTLRETTSEIFNPEKTAIRSEQISERRSSEMDAKGIPGQLSNEPPGEPTLETGKRASGGMSTGTGQKNATRNYEVDRTISHEKKMMGHLTRLTVAIVVDQGQEGTSEEGDNEIQVNTAEISELVKNAVGFNKGRGDSVTVMNASFTEAVETELALWRDPQFQNIAKQLMVAIVFVVMVLTIFRPVVMNIIHPERAKEKVDAEERLLMAQAMAGGDGQGELLLKEGETLEDMKARLKPKKSSISADMLDTANTYDDKVAVVRMLVREDSKRVANVMRTWVKKDLG